MKLLYLTLSPFVLERVPLWIISLMYKAGWNLYHKCGKLAPPWSDSSSCLLRQIVPVVVRKSVCVCVLYSEIKRLHTPINKLLGIMECGFFFLWKNDIHETPFSARCTFLLHKKDFDNLIFLCVPFLKSVYCNLSVGPHHRYPLIPALLSHSLIRYIW